MKIMNKFQKKLANRKKDNKGFSLVELIIVIAIMAILVGIVGTQVIPYINKSKVEKDRQLVNSYCTAAVSAYSMVAGDLTSDPTSFDVYGSNSGSNATVAAKIQELTYSSFDSTKFKSKEAQGCSDVTISFDSTNHTVTATLKGAATPGDLTVTSDL